MPSTKYAILGALMPGPKHGYEILRFLISHLEPAWHVSSSQLYLLLKKLEAENLLQSNVETQENRPFKRVFLLTPAGRKSFIEWIRRPTDHVRDLRIEFLAKLFFFHNLDLPGGNALVDAQIALLKQVEEGLTAKRRSEKNDYNRLVYGFRISTLTGWLDWLKKEAILFVK